MIGRRLLRPALAALALSAALAGCGGKHAAYKSAKVTSPGSEGTFLAVGPLKYQVQLSRAMNPNLVADADWIRDLGQGVTPPGRGKEWFGIWLQIQNERNRPFHTATSLRITDAAGHSYRPVPMTSQNVLAYKPQIIPPHTLLPLQNSIAYRSDTQGMFVLFKLDYGVYQNRPLNLHIGRGPAAASVQLDL
jgi:hypothetical protein